MTKTILIADENALVRKMMRSLFEASQFEVVDAADGAEGDQKAQEINPDLIVLDLAMPIMKWARGSKSFRTIAAECSLVDVYQ
jgi:CheY-like chemotaxis protein